MPAQHSNEAQRWCGINSSSSRHLAFWPLPLPLPLAMTVITLRLKLTRLDWMTLCMSHWLHTNTRISSHLLFDTFCLIFRLFRPALVLPYTCTHLVCFLTTLGISIRSNSNFLYRYLMLHLERSGAELIVNSRLFGEYCLHVVC